MQRYDNSSFGKIPHGWFEENGFINNITLAERWILTCLASYIWRSKKADPHYEIDKALVRLYKENNVLITLLPERSIARKCGLNRSTVCKAIGKVI
ncbi:MAG: hypothetical protein JRI71_01580 [Deltaproteobacteria bacterium]|nr:hypothetical protein [Deltaproteobacteria bacterium]